MTEPRAKARASAVPYPYWTDGINDPKDTSRLVKRSKLSDLMNYDPRASYRHKRLWEFHLGWAHRDYNWTSLASVRRTQAEMLARSPTGKAISIQNIASGNRDLTDWQYLFEDEKGKGRRGSRYSINWQLLELASRGQFPVSVHPIDDATSVHPVGDTAVHPVGDAKSASVHPASDKDPTTQTRLQDGATSSSNGSAAPATPPHAAGLAPASGEAPQGRASATVPDAQAEVTSAGGFEEFWNAYAHKQQRAKAKAAWAKLDPSPELASAIIAEAIRWAAHYAEHAIEPRWRVMPHNWLVGENWLQDLPIVHKDAKSAAIVNVRGRAKPTSTMEPKPAKPAVRTTVRVTSADVVKAGSTTELRITARDGDGFEHGRILLLEDDDAESQFEGQRQFASLVHAAGLEQIDDSADLLGRAVIITEDGFTAPDIRPDDEPPLPVKPEPVRYANPEPTNTPNESPRDFAVRMATSISAGWPAWMGAEYEEDDEAA